MSDLEQVDSFNPILMLIWILGILVVAIDYSQDKIIKWSIPVVGSVFFVQLYMLWKTNYDEMVKEQNEIKSQHMGGDIVKQTPIITPGKTKLSTLKNSTMVDLTLSPSLIDED